MTIASKCSFGKGQGILDAQHAEVEACLQGSRGKRGLGARRTEYGGDVTAERAGSAERVQALEDRLVQRDFEVQRRMALSVKEVEALVARGKRKGRREAAGVDERSAARQAR